MNDSTKSCLAVFLLFAALTLPFVGGIVGGIVFEDLRTGVVFAAIIFGVLFVTAGVLLALVRDFTWVSWLAVSLPIVLALIYTLNPLDVPGPIDDLIAILSSLALSTLLMLPQGPRIIGNILNPDGDKPQRAVAPTPPPPPPAPDTERQTRRRRRRRNEEEDEIVEGEYYEDA